MNKMTLPAMALIAFCSTSYAAETATTPPGAPPAATAPSSADCTALEKKYDAADKTKVTPDKLKKATAKRETGAKDCAAGNTTDGVKYLKSALKLIGVKSS
jgi:hypothetical protein